MKRSIKIFCLVFASMMIISSCQGKKEEAVKPAEEAMKVALSNEVFKVQVPSKFDGLYDTEVNDHTINFYDLESMKAGNPGWLFGIQVFENANDYAGGPIEKVGELKLNSGKLYDVILSYPTESQFGFSSDGSEVKMPTNYKNFYDARYEIVGTVSGNSGEKIAVGAGAKGKDLYKEVLSKHLTALKEGWEASKLEAENISPMYAAFTLGEGSALDKAGYAYRDINNDGIEELLIGELADGDWKGIIYDIYTIVDRKPAHVVSGWDRNRFYDYDDDMLVNEYSNGADESGINVYVLNNNSTELTFQLAYKYDGYTDAKNPWFVAHTKNGDEANWEPTTETDYNEKQDRFSKHVDLNYNAFSTLN